MRGRKGGTGSRGDLSEIPHKEEGRNFTPCRHHFVGRPALSSGTTGAGTKSKGRTRLAGVLGGHLGTSTAGSISGHSTFFPPTARNIARGVCLSAFLYACSPPPPGRRHGVPVSFQRNSRSTNLPIIYRVSISHLQCF